MKTTMNVERSMSGITLTSKNAPRFANRLKKSLKEEGIVLPLNQCYEHLAQAFGASNWHELKANLQKDELRALENNEIVQINEPSEINKSSNLMNLNWVEFRYIINHLLRNLHHYIPNELDVDAIWYILELNRNSNNEKVEIDWDSICKVDNLYNDIVQRLKGIADESVAVSSIMSEKFAHTVPKKVEQDYRKFIKKGNQLNTNYIREVIMFLNWLAKNNLMLYRHNQEELLKDTMKLTQNNDELVLESDYPFLKIWCYGYAQMKHTLKKGQKNLTLHDAMLATLLHGNDRESEIVEICAFLIHSHDMAINAWKKMPEEYRGKIVD